jgi:hypothetical protein
MPYGIAGRNGINRRHSFNIAIGLGGIPVPDILLIRAYNTPSVGLQLPLDREDIFKLKPVNLLFSRCCLMLHLVAAAGRAGRLQVVSADVHIQLQTANFTEISVALTDFGRSRLFDCFFSHLTHLPDSAKYII